LNTIIPQEMPATMSNGMTTDRVSHRGRANTAWPHTHQPTTAPEIGRATPASTVTRKPVARKRLTIYLPVDLLERARNTVYWTSGTTLAGLIEQALSHTLDSRESLNGGRFPPRLAELKGGRPRGKRRLTENDGRSPGAH